MKHPPHHNSVIQTFETEDECDPPRKHFAVYLLKEGLGGQTPTDQKNQPKKERQKKKDDEIEDSWDQEL